MSQEELKKQAGALKEKIAATDVSDQESREKLDAITESLDNVLEHPGDGDFSHHRNLMEQLTDAVERFEVSHPTLTGMINNVVQTLNTLGI